MGGGSLSSNEGLSPSSTESARARRVIQVVFVLFCIEIGLILLALPWTPLWENNFFFSLSPDLRRFWMNPHMRGAISGLGVVNLWIAASEAIRMMR